MFSTQREWTLYLEDILQECKIEKLKRVSTAQQQDQLDKRIN